MASAIREPLLPRHTGWEVSLLISHSLFSHLSVSRVPQPILTLMLLDVSDLTPKGEDAVVLAWNETNPSIPEQPS